MKYIVDFKLLITHYKLLLVLIFTSIHATAAQWSTIYDNESSSYRYQRIRNLPAHFVEVMVERHYKISSFMTGVPDAKAYQARLYIDCVRSGYFVMDERFFGESRNIIEFTDHSLNPSGAKINTQSELYTVKNQICR